MAGLSPVAVLIRSYCGTWQLVKKCAPSLSIQTSFTVWHSVLMGRLLPLVVVILRSSCGVEMNEQAILTVFWDKYTLLRSKEQWLSSFIYQYVFPLTLQATRLLLSLSHQRSSPLKHMSVDYQLNHLPITC